MSLAFLTLSDMSAGYVSVCVLLRELKELEVMVGPL